MTILVDTNVIVDVLSKRDGYHDSLNVIRACETKKATGFVSAITVNDIMYILRKHLDPATVKDAVQSLLFILEVADVTRMDITRAFDSGMKDFEDAVQASCAKRIKADYIVTRNLKDFAQSPVPAISPVDAVKLLLN